MKDQSCDVGLQDEGKEQGWKLGICRDGGWFGISTLLKLFQLMLRSVGIVEMDMMVSSFRTPYRQAARSEKRGRLMLRRSEKKQHRLCIAQINSAELDTCGAVVPHPTSAAPIE